MSSYTYLKKSTMQYPLHQGDIRLMYPDMGEEFVIPDEDIVEVEETSLPAVEENQYYIEQKPILIDGKWVRQFDVIAMTEEEITARKEMMEKLFPNPPVDPSTANTADPTP